MKDNPQTVETDVLVVGGGLAGAFAAIKAREAGVGRVTLVSKGTLGKDSISTFAAGVFQPAFPDDDKDALFKMYASDDNWGGGLCDPDWLKVYLDESYDRVLDLDRWGVEYLKTPEGQFERLLGRWQLPFVMFHGPQMMEAVARKVRKTNIKVTGHMMITDLLTDSGAAGGRVVGAIGFDVRTGEITVFKAGATILAAGACAFKGRYIGHSNDTGDAYAMAYQAGTELGRFEIGDILHTTATNMDLQGLNMFVGLGGKFLNAEGERFMLEYSPEYGDTVSMARIAEASAMEVRAGRGPIYLDMTHFDAASVNKLKSVLPIPSRVMEQAGVIVGDKIVKKMEWAPTFFGTIAAGGGVLADTRCETSLPGLYACGDAMARAKHFPKALAGAAVSGHRAGVYAAEYAARDNEGKINEAQITNLLESLLASTHRKEGIEPDHIIIGIQEALLPYEVTVIARADRLEKAIGEITRIRTEEVPLLRAPDAHYLRISREISNMAIVAEMYLRSRLLRQESRDGCVREDFPYTDNVNWLKWTLLKQDGTGMKLWTEDIALPPELKPEKQKYLYPVFVTATKRGIRWG